MYLLNKYNALALTMCALLGAMPACFAESYQGSVTKTKVQSGTYLQRHPVVKRTAIGAGVGAGAGALTGLVTGKGALRGALIGTGTGAGVGLIRSSKTLKRHPVAKHVATGTAVGLGLGFGCQPWAWYRKTRGRHNWNWSCHRSWHRTASRRVQIDFNTGFRLD